MSNRTPDPTRRDATVDVLHGVSVADPYRWLEAPDSAEVADFVARQNAATDAFLSTLPERARFRERLEELNRYQRCTIPIRRGAHWFSATREAGRNQPDLTRQTEPSGPRETVLDVNALSADGTVSLNVWSISRDGRWLAYGTSEAGSDWTLLRVRDLATGADLADEIRWSKFSGACWLPGGTAFLYARFPEPVDGVAATRHQRVYRHVLGTPQAADALVFEAPTQPGWSFYPQPSEDGRSVVLFVSLGSRRLSRIFVAASGPDSVGPWEDLTGDHVGTFEPAGAAGDRFFFRTDVDAPSGRVVAIDRDRPGVLVEIVAERAAPLRTVRLVGGRLWCHTLEHATSRLESFDLDGRSLGQLALPTATVQDLGGSVDGSIVFLELSSFVDPPSIHRYDAATDELSRLPAAAPAIHDLHTEQIFCDSDDGTRIPAFVCWRGVRPDGARPTVLYGYGGFDNALTPAYDATVVAWLDRGGVYVVANLRGGGEYGRAWHEAGCREHRQNVFDDFRSVADHLVAQGWCRRSTLSIHGRSNGGLLVGASLVQHPDRFAAAVPAVGVLDMLRYHRFTVGWAWVGDYGCADEPEMFPVLLRYSPVHNAVPAVYPPVLLTTGAHDDRVVPAHSYKFAAALQHAQRGDAPILLRIDTRGGHGAGKALSRLLDERADTWSFLWWALTR